MYEILSFSKQQKLKKQHFFDANNIPARRPGFIACSSELQNDLTANKTLKWKRHNLIIFIVKNSFSLRSAEKQDIYPGPKKRNIRNKGVYYVIATINMICEWWGPRSNDN